MSRARSPGIFAPRRIDPAATPHGLLQQQKPIVDKSWLSAAAGTSLREGRTARSEIRHGPLPQQTCPSGRAFAAAHIVRSRREIARRTMLC